MDKFQIFFYLPDGEKEISPCDDSEKKLEIYQSCKRDVTSIFNVDIKQPNYGITPDNCRYSI